MSQLLSYPIIFVSVFLSIHALISIWQMIYSWADEDKIKNNTLPETITDPKTYFTVIVPAYHEEKVIKSTILQLIKQAYPPT